MATARTAGVAALTVVLTMALGGMLTTSVATAQGDEPIVIMNIGTYESPAFSAPQQRTAIEARADAINEGGGVNGRPLEVEFCNDKFDPNEAAACARQAAEIGALAVVGGSTAQAAAIFPILTDAGIPWIGGAGSSGEIELVDPISYPIHGASPAMHMGVGRTLAEQSDNVAVITEDQPGARRGGDELVAGVEAAGGSAELHVAPAGTVDFSGTVASALGGDVDAVGIATSPDGSARVIRAIRQAGFDGPIATTAALLPQETIDALGGDAESIYVGFRMVPVASTDNPAVEQFISEMTAEDDGARIDELGLNAWTATNLVVEAAKQIDEIDNVDPRAARQSHHAD